MKRELLWLFFVILFSNIVSATLGISPAKIEIDFIPGEEYEFVYTVISDDLEKEFDLYVSGDLSQYATLSTGSIIGPGDFVLRLKLPNNIEKPGEHRIGVGVREKPSEEQFIGTAIDISGAIKIFVPYPGRYIETELGVADGNIDDQIPIEVHISNKGKENLNINLNVQFFSNNIMIYDMPFTPAYLESTQDRYFRKFLDTSGYKPGNYLAEAEVYYGEEVKVNKTFRIGSLFVNITNFTDRLQRGDIQRFLIDIESMWNDDLDSVYADINVSNNAKSFTFRTPPTDLKAWEKKTLEGFFDTSELEGKYRTEIVLNYAGQRSFAIGELSIFNRGLSFIFIFAGVIAFVSVIVVIFIIWKLKKNAFRRVRKK